MVGCWCREGLFPISESDIGRRSTRHDFCFLVFAALKDSNDGAREGGPEDCSEFEDVGKQENGRQ